MTSLRERLEAKSLERTVLTVRGERFCIAELSRSERSRLIASTRDKTGKSNNDKLEGVLLSACVLDDTEQTIYSSDEWQKWDALGAGITGPLFAEVMRLNGLDNDDVGREVKNSDTTESSS